MKTLRRLASVLVLTLMLGLPSFAGETHTPPCAPPDPGETHTPPCQPAAPGDIGSSGSSTLTGTDETFAEIVIVLESMLLIF